MKTELDNQAAELTKTVMSFWSSRRGFDWWFDHLESDVKREIKRHLQAAIKKKLKEQKEKVS